MGLPRVGGASQQTLNDGTAHTGQQVARIRFGVGSAFLRPDEPAELPSTNRETGALLLLLGGALADLPTGNIVHGLFAVQGQQDQQLDHDPNRHVSPTLFVALHRLL